jgi:uncharacterized protein
MPNVRYAISMKFAKAGHSAYFMRLDPGDDIARCVEQLCANKNILNATITGIGSVVNPVLAHYRIDRQQYREETLEGIYEVTNLSGNVAIADGHPFAHLHVAISDEQMRAFGGHLVSGAVSATAELLLTAFPTAYEKRMNPEIGLRVWDLR